ncbi:MAG: hypothetical protein RIQ52_453 [Pseudomonadota bacterium]|jgi:asparagine synthetase A
MNTNSPHHQPGLLKLGRHLLNPVLRLFAEGCHRIYYQLREGAGHPKRDIMVSRVIDAREHLEGAKEQFQSALEKFSALTHFEGGELEPLYYDLKDEFDNAQHCALAVRDRIDSIQDVAEALFAEWEQELALYSNRTLRASSRTRMKQTQQYYGQLMTAMRKAEARMDPVLSVFQDQVLFLKHNLNAQAVAALEGELVDMSRNVATLIAAMQNSIDRADVFMHNFTAPKSLPHES